MCYVRQRSHAHILSETLFQDVEMIDNRNPSKNRRQFFLTIALLSLMLVSLESTVNMKRDTQKVEKIFFFNISPS